MNNEGFQGRRPAVIRTGNDPSLAERDAADWRLQQEAANKDESAKASGFLNNIFARIGCGCLVPIVFTLGALGSIAAPDNYGSGSPAYLVGKIGGMLIAGLLLIWLPLYLFWLRNRSRWVIAGSLLAATALFTVIGLAGIGRGVDAMRKDAGALSQIVYDANGNPTLPADLEKNGPMSAFIADMYAEQKTLREDFNAEIAKLRVEDLMAADKVAREPELAQNCARITQFSARIADYRRRNIALVDNVPARIDAMDISPSARAEMKQGALASQDANRRLIDREWDVQQKSVAPMHRACLILSKRNWKAQGAVFAFSNAADMKGFNAAMDELKSLDDEIKAINAERKARAEAGQKMLRME